MSGAYREEDREVLAALGQRLRELRHDLDLTQYEMAVVAGIPQNQISEYERGTRYPRLASLRRLALALNTSVAQLLEGVC